MEKVKIRELNKLPKLYLVAALLLCCGLAWLVPAPSIMVGIIAIALLLFVMILHEVLHGIGFKAFTGKVVFGVMWKKFVAYASSPGALMTKKQFLIIALLPQLMAIPCLIIIYLSYNITLNYLAYIFLISNLCGGVSDWWMALTVAHYKENVIVEDTKVGAIIYAMKEVA